MNNDLVLFENPQFGKVRTVVKDNEPWFVGKDVAEALGYTRPSDAISAHVDAEDKLTRQFTDSGQGRDMIIINESGLYSLIFSSQLESAKTFKHWVTSEVLPSIRKTGSYSLPTQESQYKLSSLAIKEMAEALHINDASKALMYDDLNKQFGIKLALPYLQNARAHKSATDLLKENECELKINAFNSLLVSKGYAVRNTKGTHTFCTLTNKGLKYGENLCSPKSQGKTQIHLYTDSFKELYAKLTQD